MMFLLIKKIDVDIFSLSGCLARLVTQVCVCGARNQTIGRRQTILVERWIDGRFSDLACRQVGKSASVDHQFCLFCYKQEDRMNRHLPCWRLIVVALHIHIDGAVLTIESIDPIE